MIGWLNDVLWINMLYIYFMVVSFEGVFILLFFMVIMNMYFIIYFVVYGLVDGILGCGFVIVVLNSFLERLKFFGFGFYNCFSCIFLVCGFGLGGILIFI